MHHYPVPPEALDQLERELLEERLKIEKDIITFEKTFSDAVSAIHTKRAAYQLIETVRKDLLRNNRNGALSGPLYFRLRSVLDFREMYIHTFIIKF